MEDSPITLEDFWELVDEGSNTFGCTPLQIAYVKVVMAGAKGAAAAKMAGYTGDDRALGVMASRLKRNDKVKALLAAARQAKDAETGTMVGKDELKMLLSREARDGETPTARLKAQEILAKHYQLFAETGFDVGEKSAEETFATMSNEDVVNLKLVVDTEYNRRVELHQQKQEREERANGKTTFQVIDGDGPGAA